MHYNCSCDGISILIRQCGVKEKPVFVLYFKEFYRNIRVFTFFKLNLKYVQKSFRFLSVVSVELLRYFQRHAALYGPQPSGSRYF